MTDERWLRIRDNVWVSLDSIESAAIVKAWDGADEKMLRIRTKSGAEHEFQRPEGEPLLRLILDLVEILDPNRDKRQGHDSEQQW